MEKIVTQETIWILAAKTADGRPILVMMETYVLTTISAMVLDFAEENINANLALSVLLELA
jgi:hypothetical protein